MRERPILFSAPMVRAILEGHKTQTRRLVKPQPHLDGVHDDDCSKLIERWGWEAPDGRYLDPEHYKDWLYELAAYCPYGNRGDRLWVRETFAGTRELPAGDVRYVYRADEDNESLPFGWQSGICMPRPASRITLEVTGVRVERLQDICEADVVAEGVSTPGPLAVHHFRDLWVAVNGEYAWNANPWVWVVEFRPVKPQ